MQAGIDPPGRPRYGTLDLAVLAAAMSFPTLMAWVYFVVLPGQEVRASTAQQAAYTLGKVVQLTLPLLFVRWMSGRWPLPRRPSTRGLAAGTLFGLLVVAFMLGLYFFRLEGSSLLADTPARVRVKLVEMGVASPGRYLALACFFCLAHALFEEYYWRWFVFGRLRAHLPVAVAMSLSSLAFMSHHVVVLHVFLPGSFWQGVAPFSLAIAVGGGYWAWLYQRTGSLLGPWVSHLLVDAGIFYLGWQLASRGA